MKIDTEMLKLAEKQKYCYLLWNPLQVKIDMVNYFHLSESSPK